MTLFHRATAPLRPCIAAVEDGISADATTLLVMHPHRYGRLLKWLLPAFRAGVRAEFTLGAVYDRAF